MRSAKAELHSIIDSLSEYQASKLKKVVSLFITEFLAADQEGKDKDQTIIKAFMNVPEDDEPLTADELAAIIAAEEDIKAGKTRPLADVAKELGL